MNAEEEAKYRLQEAERYLAEAGQLLNFQQWRSCVSSAQLAIENTAKAITACFGPVPRNHDMVEHLRGIPLDELPQDLAEEVQTIIPIVARYGLKKHILVTYGDEGKYLTPWELFGEKEAVGAVEDARQCVALAEAVYNHFFKQRRKNLR